MELEKAKEERRRDHWTEQLAAQCSEGVFVQSKQLFFISIIITSPFPSPFIFLIYFKS